jgi:hypothetical protein
MLPGAARRDRGHRALAHHRGRGGRAARRASPRACSPMARGSPRARRWPGPCAARRAPCPGTWEPITAGAHAARVCAGSRPWEPLGTGNRSPGAGRRCSHRGRSLAWSSSPRCRSWAAPSPMTDRPEHRAAVSLRSPALDAGRAPRRAPGTARWAVPGRRARSWARRHVAQMLDEDRHLLSHIEAPRDLCRALLAERRGRFQGAHRGFADADALQATHFGGVGIPLLLAPIIGPLVLDYPILPSNIKQLGDNCAIFARRNFAPAVASFPRW